MSSSYDLLNTGWTELEAPRSQDAGGGGILAAGNRQAAVPIVE